MYDCLDAFILVFLTGMASGVASTTIGSSQIFKPLRQRLSKIRFLGELIQCPYCLGHWISLAFYWYVFDSFGLIGWLSVTAVSTITSGLLTKLYG